ncbi:hypothetical protein F1559_003230 [Cyanidiococcus yangmingshanensis]|uniref:Aspartyl/asparaginy/proline hydroxylase domain-containing protein n=1 Tax=Cyanidiococcus yangmingshanensis TaxID=2690220 RepID=A0A7J7IQL9_9RHOD|nr:hypothetical protein F1559_003230 [Cyanidiococcus yangmingshanensis]
MSRRERPAFVALVHNVATPRHRQGDFKKLYGSNRLLMSFAERVERSLRKKFPADAIQRVLEAWRQIQRGELLQEDQREAHSYIRGIRSAKFFDCAEFPWVASFEKNWETIRDELWHWESRRQELEQRGSRVWAKAARAEAVAYGPDWRTLVLQDRRWDEDNCKLFSKTNQVIRGSGVPSVEAFFARQAPQSGIKPHSDGCNFILTAHLALSAPPNALVDCRGRRTSFLGERQSAHFRHELHSRNVQREHGFLPIRAPVAILAPRSDIN